MSSVMDAPPPPTCQHFTHPAHRLSLVQVGGAQFRCDGCKQLGGQADRRYRCEPCDFDLHIQCALAPPVFQHPTFGPGFTLCSGVSKRFCDLCGDGVLGTLYHNSQAGLDLHPCCAFLKDSVSYHGRLFQLRVKVAASCMICGQNGQRGEFWSYTLDGGVENIHVACMLYADHNQTGAAGGTRSTYSQGSGNSISGHQMIGNPISGHHHMTGNPNSGHHMMGNPTNSHQMTGNPTSGQMTGTWVHTVVQPINDFTFLANNILNLTHNCNVLAGDNSKEEPHTQEHEREELHAEYDDWQPFTEVDM